MTFPAELNRRGLEGHARWRTRTDDLTGNCEEHVTQRGGDGHDGQRVNPVGLLGRQLVQRSLGLPHEPVVKLGYP